MLLQARGWSVQVHIENVSIPSTGRVLLQDNPPLGNKNTPEGFNTLYGSSVTASLYAGAEKIFRTWFQYPLRVECYCKLPQSAVCNPRKPCFNTLYGSSVTARDIIGAFQGAVLEFQYPLRVECYCKRCNSSMPIQALPRFNTLYGSSVTARICVQSLVECYALFQYPLRVECYCKNITRSKSVPTKCVSIPSTGRVLLQVLQIPA